MMKLKNKLLAIAFGMCGAGSLFAAFPAYEKFAHLKEELGLSVIQELRKEEKVCHLYIVHHGDTEYTVEERLQGWIDIPCLKVY